MVWNRDGKSAPSRGSWCILRMQSINFSRLGLSCRVNSNTRLDHSTAQRQTVSRDLRIGKHLDKLATSCDRPHGASLYQVSEDETGLLSTRGMRQCVWLQHPTILG